MFKLKRFIDIEKEEAWLRSMSAQGWDLFQRGSVGYWFNQTGRGEQIYRIDYRTFKKQSDFVDYVSLFHDSGWEHISGKKGSHYQYFVAREGNPALDIFSDDAARRSRYARLAASWIQILVLYLIILVSLISSGYFDVNPFLDPKALYFTPGLWSAQGARFWIGFLFETPFVILRNFLWVLVPVVIAISAYYAIRALILSKNHSA